MWHPRRLSARCCFHILSICDGLPTMLAPPPVRVPGLEPAAAPSPGAGRAAPRRSASAVGLCLDLPAPSPGRPPRAQTPRPLRRRASGAAAPGPPLPLAAPRSARSHTRAKAGAPPARSPLAAAAFGRRRGCPRPRAAPRPPPAPRTRSPAPGGPRTLPPLCGPLPSAGRRAPACLPCGDLPPVLPLSHPHRAALTGPPGPDGGMCRPVCAASVPTRPEE